MRLQALFTTALLASLASADSIALSSFTPRIDDLPSACDRVYNTPIAGCSSKDFIKTCSASCINGLVAISKAVTASCSNVDVPETSIIGVFLLGKGIPALCSNTVVTTVGTSDTPAATSTPEQTSAKESSSSNAAASTSAAIIVDPSASPEKSSSTLSTQTSASPAPESSAAVTSKPAAAASSATPATLGLSSSSTSSSKGAKKTGTQQLSNSASGGGSPFDVQAAAHVDRAPKGLLALVVGLIAVMLTVR